MRHFEHARNIFDEYARLYGDSVTAGGPGDYSDEDLEKYKLFRGLAELAEGLMELEDRLAKRS